MNCNCQDSYAQDYQMNNQNYQQCQQNNNQCRQQCNNQCGQFYNNQCCQQSCCSCQCGRPRPIFAPKRVCTTFQNQYVEQPVICPIECRRVHNIVYVPRYYPQYEQTCYSQNNTMSM